MNDFGSTKREAIVKLCDRDESTLTPQQFLLTIAKRGGYLNRKCDPRPG